MIACVDVHYRDASATAASVVFADWADELVVEQATVSVDHIAPYEPGQFFRRELPCILAVLSTLKSRPRIILIDGYVWLGDEGVPGLGGYLYEALGGRVGVIGVAKTRYRHAEAVLEIKRGQSQSPLFVTAGGLDLGEAARRILEMHGPFRLPSLLKRVDRLCRGLPADI